jgi:hypothetical protein
VSCLALPSIVTISLSLSSLLPGIIRFVSLATDFVFVNGEQYCLGPISSCDGEKQAKNAPALGNQIRLMAFVSISL